MIANPIPSVRWVTFWKASLVICAILIVPAGITNAIPQGEQPEIELQAGHAYTIWALAASTDGNLVASSALDRTIKIWSLSDARLWRTIQGPFGIDALAFSADGRLLASGADAEITIFDVMTGSELRRITVCDAVIKQARSSGDVGYAAPSAVVALAFSPRGQFVASACDGDESVKVWDFSTGRLARTFNVPTNSTVRGSDIFGMPYAKPSEGFSSMAFDSTGRWLAAGTGDHSVRVWEFSTGRQALDLRGHPSDVRSLAFSGDSRFITTSDSRVAVLWDVASGATLQTRAGAWSAFDFQGRWMVADKDGKLVASRTGGNGVEQPAGSLPPSLPVLLSPDGRWLIGSGGQTLVARNLASGADVQLFDFIVTRRRMATSHDGNWLVIQPYYSNDTELKMKLWNVRTNEIRTLSGPGGYNAVFSGDDHSLAAAADDKMIRLWDPVAAKELSAFAFGQSVGSVSLNRTGNLLAASGYSGTPRAWDVSSGETLQGYVEDGSATGVSFSSDSRWLAYSTRNGVKIVDTETRGVVRTIEGSLPISFSPDSRMLAVNAGRGKVTIWDVSSGREVRTLAGEFEAQLLVFSPDRHWFALRDRDGKIFLWDLDGIRDVRRFTGFNLGFTAGGAYLWINGEDGITRFRSTENGTIAASLAIIEGSNDWAIAASDGRFDGTTRGIQKLIAWRVGNRILPPDQFMQRRTSGLLTNLLGSR